VLYPNRSHLDGFLKVFLKEQLLSVKQRGYVAPTVFLLKDKIISGYNYYNTLDDAFAKLKYLFHDATGRNVTPAGSVPFKKDGTAQTLGINVDFYFAVNSSRLVNLGYVALKAANATGDYIYGVFRFYKTNGSGPYYSVYDPTLFGATATPAGSYSADKIEALDKFHREVALLKSKHNTLAIYLNSLAAKKRNTAEDHAFIRGNFILTAMRAELATLQGVEVYYSKDGTIGVIAIPLIAWVIIGAIASWGVPKILEQFEKTKRINASYDTVKWVHDQKVWVFQELKAGRITQEHANLLLADLDKLSATATKNAEASAAGSSMFGDVTELIKWGALLFAVVKILPMITDKKTS
jgi:hypothetical protein